MVGLLFMLLNGFITTFYFYIKSFLTCLKFPFYFIRPPSYIQIRNPKKKEVRSSFSYFLIKYFMSIHVVNLPGSRYILNNVNVDIISCNCWKVTFAMSFFPFDIIYRPYGCRGEFQLKISN